MQKDRYKEKEGQQHVSVVKDGVKRVAVRHDRRRWIGP